MADENSGFEEAVGKMLRDAERMTSSIMTGDSDVDQYLTVMLEICQEHFGQSLERAEQSIHGYIHLIEVMAMRAGMEPSEFANKAPDTQKYLYLGFAAGIISANHVHERLAKMKRKGAEGDEDAS